jgi:hypothetical protein
MTQLGDVLKINEQVFVVTNVLDGPGKGLVEISENRGIDIFKFTMPVAILDELLRLLALDSVPRGSSSPGIRELAKDNADLQEQLKQMTARRNEGLRIIEEKRGRIYELEAQVENPRNADDRWPDCGNEHCRRHTNRVDQGYCPECKKVIKRLEYAE